MFAVIDTNGANRIVIHIPSEGSERSLPALARMLEQNAVFINAGYHESKTVSPSMTITLGAEYRIEESRGELLVSAPDSPAVIDEHFVNLTPEVLVSNAKALAQRDEQISRQRTEIDHLKVQLKAAQETLDEVNAERGL